MKGAMHQVRGYFLSHPMERSSNMLNMIAQIVITYHNDRAGKPLVVTEVGPAEERSH